MPRRCTPDELTDGRIAVTEYYNLNNNGFGTLLAFPAAKQPNAPPFGKARERVNQQCGAACGSSIRAIPRTCSLGISSIRFRLLASRPSVPSRMGKMKLIAGAGW